MLKYILGLLKHIPTSHADYHSTNMALVKMQSVIRKMSVKLRESVATYFVVKILVDFISLIKNICF